MSDLIDRQAAIDAFNTNLNELVVGGEENAKTVENYLNRVLDKIKYLPSALGTNLAEVGTDTISRQAAINKILGQPPEPHYPSWYAEQIKELPSAQLDTYWKEQCQSYEQTINKLRESLSTQPEIIRCKDCKCWVPGYITDNDDFIPPKCGEWQQMVGHSSDDYCSLAERRED